MFDLFAEIVLDKLGGFVRYLYGYGIRKMGLSKSPYYSLHEYIHGSNRPEDEHWDKGYSHAFANRLVGIITLVVLISLIMNFL